MHAHLFGQIANNDKLQPFHYLWQSLQPVKASGCMAVLAEDGSEKWQPEIPLLTETQSLCMQKAALAGAQKLGRILVPCGGSPG